MVPTPGAKFVSVQNLSQWLRIVIKPLVLQCLSGVRNLTKWWRLKTTCFTVFKGYASSGRLENAQSTVYFAVLQCLRGVRIVAKWQRLENTYFTVLEKAKG